MRFSLMNITSLFPFNLLRRVTGVNPLIVNYHIVSDDKLPHVSNLYRYRDIKTFIQDLEFLTRYFNPISLHDLLAKIHDNLTLPENSVLLTFDDGFKEIFEIVAPVFADKNLTATVFLTKNFIDNRELGYDHKKSILIDYIRLCVDKTMYKKTIDLLETNNLFKEDLVEAVLGIPYVKRKVIDELAATMNIDFHEYLENHKPYLTSSQIYMLIERGFTFGGHSIDHPRFSELSSEDQINQAINSIEFITNRFNLNYRVFAFPYNDMKVPASFFRAISDKVDATFGTSGLLVDTITTNFQRISVEKSKKPAYKAVKFYYARKMIYQLIGKDSIPRSG
jgi:peptidoglycan/xylan/chitin deacetylase (PgdA/CDA1 family)